MSVDDMSNSIPKSLEDRKDQRVNESDIVNLSNAFENCVAYIWTDFAIKCLALGENHISNIEHDKNHRTEQIRSMFQKWKEVNREGSKVQNINEILHKYVPGIKEMWWNSYRDSSDQAILDQKKMDLNKYFEKLSGCAMTPEEWSKLVAKLNLSKFQEDIENRCKHDKFRQRYELLLVWAQIKGYGYATISTLQDALKKLKLRRIICEIAGLEDPDRKKSIDKIYEHFLEDEWDYIFNEKLNDEQKRKVLNNLLPNEDDVSNDPLERAFQKVMFEGNRGFHKFMKVLGSEILCDRPENKLQDFFRDSNYLGLFDITQMGIVAPHFTENANYKELCRLLEVSPHRLHLYGMPGSGKSQLASYYAKRFGQKHPTAIIWTVECTSWESVDGALLALRRDLLTARIISAEHSTWDKIVKRITIMETPVLLLLEDVTSKAMSHKDLEMIMQSLNGYDQSQVIATSRNKAPQSIQQFCEFKVEGFTLAESVTFLLEGRENEERESAEKIAEIYSCLPLGLAPARAYCIYLDLTYAFYCSLIEQESSIHNFLCEDDSERNILTTMSLCLNNITPFTLGGHSVDLKEVFSMARFFHHENIPVYLFKQALSHPNLLEIGNEVQLTERSQKVMLLQLFQHLKKSSVANVNEEKDIDLKLISTHQVVQKAMEGMISDQESVNEQLLMALYCLSCYFQKDNRLDAQHNQLLVLLPHVTKALSKALSLVTKPQSLENTPEASAKKLMQQMIIIRLLEVKGFASTQIGSTEDADEPLEKAYDQLYELLCSAGNITVQGLTGLVNERVLEGNGPDTVIETEARLLYQFCVKAVDQIPAETFDQLICTMVLNKEDIELLKRNEPEWQPMPPNTPLTTRNIEQLRNHKLALTADQLKSVYLAEQLASILYTRGRLMFYKGFDQSRKEECIKFIKLAFYVAKEVARQTGIKLLHYLIAETNGLLYLKLALNNKSDYQKRQDYGDAYRRYDKLCVSTNKYFEHGIMKEDGKTSYHVMRCYKQMISANMQQLKLPGEKMKDNWFEVCDKLEKIVEDHPSFGKTATEGLIIAGELCRVGKKYERALELFKKAMDRVRDKEQSYKKELFSATEKFTETALSAYEKSNTDSNRNWCVEAIERCDKARLLVPRHEKSLALKALSDKVRAILPPCEPASSQESAPSSETGPSNENAAKRLRKC